jgi:hypothetical protein
VHVKINSIAAVVLGIAVVVFGCLPFVGFDILHGFLVFVGALMIFFGGWDLVLK